MKKPTLYLSLDAVLIPTSDTDLSFNGRAPSAYTRAFVHWALEKFHVVWLTDESPQLAFRLNELLGVPSHSIPVATFSVSKTDVFNLKTEFYLIDDALIPGEIAWLAQHGRGNCVVATHPRDGVTPETKRQLEARIGNA